MRIVQGNQLTFHSTRSLPAGYLNIAQDQSIRHSPAINPRKHKPHVESTHPRRSIRPIHPDPRYLPESNIQKSSCQPHPPPIEPSPPPNPPSQNAKMTTAIRRILPKSVANTGSQQRDHAANERTFLSWTRAGLGFAAMALALDRLDAIDRLLTSKLPSLVSASQGGNGNHLAQSEADFHHQHHSADINGHGHKEGGQGQQQQQQQHIASSLQRKNPFSASELAQNFSATRVCQVLGLWCLGYGFFRYLSMRRYLMKGQFVPALWGPFFMAGGSLGAFASLGMQMDRRRH